MDWDPTALHLRYHASQEKVCYITPRMSGYDPTVLQLKGCVTEPNKFHNYETEKITLKASDVAEYIELFGSSTRDCHARRI